MGTTPLVTLLIAVLFRTEQVTMYKLLGISISFLGILILIFQHTSSKLTLNFGDIIILGSVLSWSLYTIMSRKISREKSSLAIASFSVFYGLPVLLIFAIPDMFISVPKINLDVAMVILFIGLFPSVIALIAWNYGVSKLGSTSAMTYINTLPIYGVILASLLLKEHITTPQLMGMLMIITGSLFATFFQKT